MIPEKIHRLDLLSRQLTEHLMSAAICAKEISEIAHPQGNNGHEGTPGANGNRIGRAGSQSTHRPLLDEATLSVIWHGRTLHLGHTHGFWLLLRLARRANQYVTHLDLLREVWEDEFTDTAALRAGVKRLREKLRRGGMGDLADAITGHHGRYMLDLAAASRHREVTAVSHRTSQV